MSLLSFLRPKAYRPEPVDTGCSMTVLQRFSGDERGTVAVIFGLTTLIIVSSVGAAVDYGRWLSARTQTVNAIDSALLAAGRAAQINGGNVTLSTQAADAYYAQMKSNLVVNDSVGFFAVNAATGFQARGTAYIQTPFLSILGINTLPVLPTTTGYVQASSTIAQGSNSGTSIEIAMMLDTTGSMCNLSGGVYQQPCTSATKLNALKDAAKDLVDIVVWDDQSAYTSRVAIAPFSQAVNVGATYFQAITGESLTQARWNGTSYNYPTSCYSRSGSLLSRCASNPTGNGATPATSNVTVQPCVAERQGTNEFTNRAPGNGSYVKTYYQATVEARASGRTNSSPSTGCPERVSILPLTNNKSVLRSRLDSLVGENGTGGALGTAWPLYMLSPEWNSIWPSSQAGNYSELTALNTRGQPRLRKIAILMTDGEYNFWGGGNAESSVVNTKATALCSSLKDRGIEVYTVGFDLDDNTNAINLLRGCATDTTHFYAASDSAALRAAFRDIALKISDLRVDH